MAGITITQAQAQLEAYLAAETAVLLGQSYEIAGRKLTRANYVDGGGYIDGKKQPHVWVPVKIYLTDDSGQVVHRWSKGLKVCAYVGDNVEADPFKIWLWCQKTINGVATLNAITQDEYNHWMTHGRWSDDAPETESQPETVADDQVVASTVTDIGTSSAGLGHNSAGDPEGADALVALLRQHEASIAEWLKVERNGEAAANKAGNWLGDLRGVGTGGRFSLVGHDHGSPVADAYRELLGLGPGRRFCDAASGRCHHASLIAVAASRSNGARSRTSATSDCSA